ncbi:MAG TPA: D-2-hydroxyacid dehydrogenase [Candidatus Polarisedimenticolaceae bacterium]|nr:D-2-hydroxyacid dehydrogenase [Candidatus Polarisedimenticolaceae bacterium]
MTLPKIVFLDAATFGDVSLGRFRDIGDCKIYQVTKPSETIGRLAGQNIVVTNKRGIDAVALAAPESQDLSLIAVAATGTDIIDHAAARKRRVKVCNVPGYAAHSVAQFTMALILELATHAGRYAGDVKAGMWQKSPVFSLLTYPSIELNGRTLAIIGYGNIGREVARMARGFGMEVLVAARPGAAEPHAADRVPLAQLLARADIVSLHCALTPETKNLMNEERLRLMKPSAFLINTARGGLIDEAALIDALSERRLAAAALDVISEEPPAADHPIIVAASALDNLMVTPHTAWSASQARERLLNEVAKNISAFLAGRDRNLVE